MKTKLICPDCSSDMVTVSHTEEFMANTDEHWCHSVKTHDSDSPSGCIDCQWSGERSDLVEVPVNKERDK